MKLSEAELSFLKRFFGERKEQFGTSHYQKARFEKNSNTTDRELLEMLLFRKGRFVDFFSFPRRFKFDELRVS